MEVSLEVLYTILVKWSNERQARTYSELSHEYHRVTGDWLEPHGSWDHPLGELANLVCSSGAPAITSLVVLKDKNEPGGDFWGCAPNVPSKPRDEMGRITEWVRMTNECFAHTWPVHISVATA